MAAPPKLIPCPSCLAFVPALAQLCTKCQAPLHATTGLAPGELEETRQLLDTLAAEANAPVDLTGQPGRFRTGSHVFALLFAGSIGLTMVGGDTALVVGGVLACMFGFIALILYMSDLVAPSVRKRRTGIEAVRCYFNSAKLGRWKAALACLSPIARRRPVTRPPIPDLRCTTAAVSFATEKGLKSYWASLIRADKGMTRRVTALRFRQVPTTSPDLETYWVDIDVEYFPTWINFLVLAGVIIAVICMVLLRRTYSMSFPVTVIKHRSQWSMLSGEIYPRLDRALTGSQALSA